MTFGAAVNTAGSVQLFERWSGGTLQTYAAGTVSGQTTVGGALSVRLGADHTAAAFPGPGELVAAAVYARALTASEVDAVYAAFDTFLARFGVTL
jgi:hypothetical protein